MTPQSHLCPVCGRGFLRRTHMLRHKATHGNEPQHPCQFCDRSFARSDVARRHAQSCTAKSEHDTVHAAKRGRRRQACDYCSTHKLSCDKKRPCQRCSSRGLSCTPGTTNQGELPARERQHRASGEEPNRLGVSYLLNLTDPNKQSMMDAMILEKTDAAFEMPSWWNRVRIGYTDTQALEADMSLLFWGVPDPFCTLSPGTDPAAEEGYWNFGPLPSPFVAESSQLYTRVNLLASELNKLNHDPMSAPIFTESNFLSFISALYRYRHSQMPIFHWPTFNPDTTSLPLLLAAALAGALFAHSPDDLTSRGLRPSQTLCDTAEKFIFTHLETFDQVTERDDVNPSIGAIETCQAALLMELIQSSFNCYKTRRRILTKRHPYLVAIMRSLRVFKSKHMPEQSKPSWQDFMQVESVIRLAIAMFSTDGMLVLYLNHPPCTTVSEMMGDLPCDERLWSAETELEFEARRASMVSSWRPPSLREMIPGLFEDQWTETHRKVLRKLSLQDLNILLWALQPTIFNLRAAMLTASCLSTVSRALERWKLLWHDAQERHTEFPLHSKGLMQYAPGHAWLLGKVLEAERDAGPQGCQHFQEIGWRNSGNVHQFIKQSQQAWKG